nr:hypothetical protein [Mycobacterium sp. 1245852.3]
MTRALSEGQSLPGERLVNSLKRSIDSAWFSAAVANGPAETLATITPTDVYAGGTAFTDADVFLEAQAAAEGLGVAVTSWVTSPGTALELASLKEAAGSNKPLLQDATAAGGRTVEASIALRCHGLAAGRAGQIAGAEPDHPLRRPDPLRRDGALGDPAPEGSVGHAEEPGRVLDGQQTVLVDKRRVRFTLLFVQRVNVTRHDVALGKGMPALQAKALVVGRFLGASRGCLVAQRFCTLAYRAKSFRPRASTALRPPQRRGR